MRSVFRPLLLPLALMYAPLSVADEVLVAVAASFLPPMESVAADFERASGHDVEIASGSTGALYAQIVNGAPFDVFVAADAERPHLLAEAGIGLPESLATVALGRLVLVGFDVALIDARRLDALREATIRHVAIANPRVAPYGVAARQTLEALGLWDTLEARIVRGESVAQAYAMVVTGNADLGLVALAQVVGAEQPRGAYVIVPEKYHTPIHQDLIVLARARDNVAAHSLRDYLLDTAARSTIASFGYATDRL